MSELNAKQRQDVSLLSAQLEACKAENKRLLDSLDADASNGLTNDELHRFNNVAALLDANIELALDALLKLPRGEEQSDQVEITTIKNFLTDALNAKSDLVDIVNTTDY